MVRYDHQGNVRLIAVLAAMLTAGAGVAAPPGLDKPLTDQPGDASRGKAVAVNSDLGNCIICHRIPIAEVPEGAFGDIGPNLAGVGARLSVAELRQRIVDPKQIDPATVMPAYFVKDGLTRVQTPYQGKTILTGQEIEDLIAYLATLK
jgi:L-cysteine S-thiosulfotransferase